MSCVFPFTFFFLKISEIEYKVAGSEDMKFKGGALQIKPEKTEVLSYELEPHNDVPTS